ncbi:nucleoside diphosphate kinase regulator [Candidatus Nitrospira allomarina]|uniref:Nucleoside diphosphate kinase regulator n=1 Tax=Candidatus Nitrospira allomarina TaxID=3020900 RepID=A0AA96JTX4_9BACT|nr:nucleoside diphosphate kinase regulator [Candidatus Nitrospira allomarina]WNM60058.1 nucleoside diphosphate kinase regulator [Candidatus Nitrospira allomarina]
MERRDIYITEFDLNRLSELLEVWQTFRGSKSTSIHLESLMEELERAHVVLPKDIPPDVVTMNSRVRLSDMSKGEELVYTLVFPRDADTATGKISILAPVGTAILGYRVGDSIEWQVPIGTRKLKIEEILYQPEAAGDFHL